MAVALCGLVVGHGAGEATASRDAGPDAPEVIVVDRGEREAVRCSLYRPPGQTADARPALTIHLYGHNGSHRSYNLGSQAFAELRRALWDRGQWVVVPELGPRHWMNDEAVDRMDAVIDAMVRDYGVDPARVSLLGTSMGAGSGLVYATKRPARVRSVVAVFPMTDYVRWAEEEPRFLSSIAEGHGVAAEASGELLESLSVVRRAEAFEGTPIMLIHGTEDTIVLPHHSRDLRAALRAIGSPVVYRPTPGIGHKNEAASPHQDAIAEFLVDPLAVVSDEDTAPTVAHEPEPTR